MRKKRSSSQITQERPITSATNRVRQRLTRTLRDSQVIVPKTKAVAAVVSQDRDSRKVKEQVQTSKLTVTDSFVKQK